MNFLCAIRNSYKLELGIDCYQLYIPFSFRFAHMYRHAHTLHLFRTGDLGPFVEKHLTAKFYTSFASIFL